MAAFNKIESFVGQLGLAAHNLNTHTLNVYLSNAAPSTSADDNKADIAEITNQNGYTAPIDTQNTYAEATGTGTLTGTKCVVTATGAVGPFQYVPIYNDTHASDALVGWWDYGSPLTLANGETFSVKFNNSDTTGTILTIA
jgi:hypothetical protein